jgi:hypothetical protein
MTRFLLLVALTMQTGVAFNPRSQSSQRLPIQKKRIILKSPTNYEKRILRYDQATGKPILYDPKPQVKLLDAKSGKYAFTWIGYDGEEKTVIYQRPDAISAIVSASVSKTANGQFLYAYKIDNLRSSGQALSDFVVQTFTSDVRPVKRGDGFVGQMSNNKVMKEGNWIFYGSSYFGPSVIPGQSAVAKLESHAPPGLVECSVTGGVFGMKGVGEEMPQELENVLPGYEIWPRCHTIGPLDKLQSVSSLERANYLIENLPQFRKLGWMTADALRWYQQNLRGSNFDQTNRRAEQDLKTGRITTEVHDMIQAIRQ